MCAFVCVCECVCVCDIGWKRDQQISTSTMCPNCTAEATVVFSFDVVGAHLVRMECQNSLEIHVQLAGTSPAGQGATEKAQHTQSNAHQAVSFRSALMRESDTHMHTHTHTHPQQYPTFPMAMVAYPRLRSASAMVVSLSGSPPTASALNT